MSKILQTPIICEKTSGPITAEECIFFWRMILTQALEDVFKGTSNVRRDALTWFLSDHENFTFVCENAQVPNTKIRQYVINSLNKKDPNLIDKILQTAADTSSKNLAPAFKPGAVKIIDDETTVSVFYKNLEIKIFFDDNQIWFKANSLNYIFKFIESNNISMADLNGIVEAKNLRKSKNRRNTVTLINPEGLKKIAKWSGTPELQQFVCSMEGDGYKQRIIDNTDIFILKFKDHKVRSWIYKNKLFFILHDIHLIFFIETDFRRIQPQETESFFLYINTVQRQLLVSANLLLKLITQKPTKKKSLLKKKPDLIKWIKQQLQIFEGVSK